MSMLDGAAVGAAGGYGGSNAVPGEGLSLFGQYTQAVGGIVSTIGAVGQSVIARETTKAASDTQRYVEWQASQNARLAELDAQQILRAGRSRIGQITAQAGQVKARQRVSAAARGVDVGQGSAAEVQATTDLVKEIEAMTITKDSVRAAGATRLQARGYEAQSLLSGVSAGNLRRSANSISPAMAGAGSLLSSAGRFASVQSVYLRRR